VSATKIFSFFPANVFTQKLPCSLLFSYLIFEQIIDTMEMSYPITSFNV